MRHTVRRGFSERHIDKVEADLAAAVTRARRSAAEEQRAAEHDRPRSDCSDDRRDA